MKKWQKYWLYFIVVYSFFHLTRDVFQDLGIKTFLSTIFVKQPIHPRISSILWNALNTYLIAFIEIVLAVVCLRRRYFGKIGYITIIITILTLFAWVIYWFFL